MCFYCLIPTARHLNVVKCPGLRLLKVGSPITEFEARAFELIRVLMFFVKISIGRSVEKGNGRESG